jgi:aromatic ring hydroxylase
MRCTIRRARTCSPCRPTPAADGYTHRFYRASRTAEELVGARDAIAEWARVSYGWIGRSPDYKAAFLATLGANSDFYAPYDENARRWYKKVRRRCRSSTTRSSIRRWIATSRSMK